MKTKKYNPSFLKASLFDEQLFEDIYSSKSKNGVKFTFKFTKECIDVDDIEPYVSLQVIADEVQQQVFSGMIRNLEELELVCEFFNIELKK